MTWAIFEHDVQLRAIGEMISTSSERVLAVVGGALLDEHVRRTLTERLRHNPDIVNNTLGSQRQGFDRPLGNLGPKIDMLYLLYALDEGTRGVMKGLTAVRNFFAHNLGASFDSLDKEFNKSLQRLTLHEGRTHYPHHLAGGDGPHALEKVKNRRDLFIVNLKLTLIALMRDRVSHVMNTNIPFTEEQLKEKLGSRLRDAAPPSPEKVPPPKTPDRTRPKASGKAQKRPPRSSRASPRFR